MKTLRLFGLVALAFTSIGCSTTYRSVTHVRIENDKAYLAYAEWEGGPFTAFTGTNDRSRVKRCLINPDNSMKCEEDADINHVLNPQETPAPPAKKAEPEPQAVPESAPEEALPEEGDAGSEDEAASDGELTEDAAAE